MNHRHAIRNHTLKLHKRKLMLQTILTAILLFTIGGTIGAMMALAI